jgi:lactoylglutathione lyase
MIKGLFETHLFVADLERSVRFYKEVLHLEQCHSEAERRLAFFWIGRPQEAMLGIWEKPAAEIDKRHFAFRCEADYILHEAVPYLKAQGLKPYNFLKDSTMQPMVFAWMPAIAIYFNDPDGHYLEFIALLEGKARPNAGILSYQQWLELERNDT